MRFAASRKYSALLFRASIVFALTFLSSATRLHASDEDIDPVFVFNRICYAQVPSVRAIEDMAERLAWNSITDTAELRKFTIIEQPDLLKGWDAQVGERIYRVGIVQSPMNSSMKETFPGLGEGQAMSCMIVLDDKHDAAKFSANMQTLAGKPPVSKDVPDGAFVTTTWAGGNDDLKVFLISKANTTGSGGLLNVTVLTREGYVSQ